MKVAESSGFGMEDQIPPLGYRRRLLNIPIPNLNFLFVVRNQ